MLVMDVFEPTQTEWEAPIVFARKKDGAFRFFVDYCKLKAVTIRDFNPIPHMDDCINYLGDATIFSTRDANSDYWQVEVADQDSGTPPSRLTTDYSVLFE